MKKIFMLFLLGILMGCQSYQTSNSKYQDRQPSSASLSKVYSCGRLELSESNQLARDKDDNNYAIKVDCNNDKKINKADGRKFLLIPAYSVNQENRQWLISQKKSIVSSTKNPNANPYVCVTAKAVTDPCGKNKIVFGFSPIFSTVK